MLEKGEEKVVEEVVRVEEKVVKVVEEVVWVEEEGCRGLKKRVVGG
jgi:hypothetical protein